MARIEGELLIIPTVTVRRGADVQRPRQPVAPARLEEARARAAARAAEQVASTRAHSEADDQARLVAARARGDQIARQQTPSEQVTILHPGESQSVQAVQQREVVPHEEMKVILNEQNVFPRLVGGNLVLADQDGEIYRGPNGEMYVAEKEKDGYELVWRKVTDNLPQRNAMPARPQAQSPGGRVVSITIEEGEETGRVERPNVLNVAGGGIFPEFQGATGMALNLIVRSINIQQEEGTLRSDDVREEIREARAIHRQAVENPALGIDTTVTGEFLENLDRLLAQLKRREASRAQDEDDAAIEIEDEVNMTPEDREYYRIRARFDRAIANIEAEKETHREINWQLPFTRNMVFAIQAAKRMSENARSDTERSRFRALAQLLEAEMNVRVNAHDIVRYVANQGINEDTFRPIKVSANTVETAAMGRMFQHEENLATAMRILDSHHARIFQTKSEVYNPEMTDVRTSARRALTAWLIEKSKDENGEPRLTQIKAERQAEVLMRIAGNVRAGLMIREYAFNGQRSEYTGGGGITAFRSIPSVLVVKQFGNAYEIDFAKANMTRDIQEFMEVIGKERYNNLAEQRDSESSFWVVSLNIAAANNLGLYRSSLMMRLKQSFVDEEDYKDTLAKKDKFIERQELLEKKTLEKEMEENENIDSHEIHERVHGLKARLKADFERDLEMRRTGIKILDDGTEVESQGDVYRDDILKLIIKRMPTTLANVYMRGDTVDHSFEEFIKETMSQHGSQWNTGERQEDMTTLRGQKRVFLRVYNALDDKIAQLREAAFARKEEYDDSVLNTVSPELGITHEMVEMYQALGQFLTGDMKRLASPKAMINGRNNPLYRLTWSTSDVPYERLNEEGAKIQRGEGNPYTIWDYLHSKFYGRRWGDVATGAAIYSTIGGMHTDKFEETLGKLKGKVVDLVGDEESEIDFMKDIAYAKLKNLQQYPMVALAMPGLNKFMEFVMGGSSNDRKHRGAGGLAWTPEEIRLSLAKLRAMEVITWVEEEELQRKLKAMKVLDGAPILQLFIMCTALTILGTGAKKGFQQLAA